MNAYEDLKKKLNADNTYLLEKRVSIMKFDGNEPRGKRSGKTFT